MHKCGKIWFAKRHMGRTFTYMIWMLKIISLILPS